MTMGRVVPEPRGVCTPDLERDIVAVCTGGHAVRGRVSCCFGQRLLDILNEGVIHISSKTRTGKDFLALEHCESISGDGGDRSPAPACLLGKPSIDFVVEFGRASEPQPGDEAQAKSRLYREKRSVAVEVVLPPYRMSGQMYLEKWEQVLSALDRPDVPFLPMTRVTIHPALPTGDTELAFVAVNRGRIVQVTEV
jgi:hypothetical protein